jgi:hypothetical protein
MADNRTCCEFAGFGQTWRENLTGKVFRLPNGQRFKVEDVYQIAFT